MHKVTSDGWRPDLSQFDTPETRIVVELIKKCWAQDPNDRPDFKSILKFVSDLQKKKKENAGLANTFQRLPV